VRQADVYAAYLAYTDSEIGRVIQAVQDMGKIDNTLIIYIVGDNGSSAEGSLIGTPNEVASGSVLGGSCEIQRPTSRRVCGHEGHNPETQPGGGKDGIHLFQADHRYPAG